MFIWRHKLCNAEMGVGSTFTWSNEAWCTQKSKLKKKSFKKICYSTFPANYVDFTTAFVNPQVLHMAGYFFGCGNTPKDSLIF